MKSKTLGQRYLPPKTSTKSMSCNKYVSTEGFCFGKNVLDALKAITLPLDHSICFNHMVFL